MSRIEMDKCTADFSMRIPEVTKREYLKLSKSKRSFIVERLIIKLAMEIHAAKFEAGVYLREDYDLNAS